MTDIAHRLARMCARHVAEQAGLAVKDSWLDGEAHRWLPVVREMLAEVERDRAAPASTLQISARDVGQIDQSGSDW